MNLTVKSVLAATGLLGALLLGACGEDTSAGAGSGEGAAAEFNDADITFAADMIPHHRQAVQMSQLAEKRAASAEVKELASQIEAAQAPEIEQLTEWLGDWGSQARSEDMDHGESDHGDDSHSTGMMSPEDLAMLEDEDGRAFDEMFLEMMIEHHEGAVDMAQAEVDQGENPDAVAMAEEIIATQTDEIEQMEKLLG